MTEERRGQNRPMLNPLTSRYSHPIRTGWTGSESEVDGGSAGTGGTRKYRIYREPPQNNYRPRDGWCKHYCGKIGFPRGVKQNTLPNFPDRLEP
jgi:hypothetical protein